MKFKDIQLKGKNKDFIEIIKYAVKAPSGHNTQPWLFKIKEGKIEIHPDFTKSLSVVDPDNRELFVSLGAATENLSIAATNKGYEVSVSISEDGIISVELVKKGTETSTLFPQIFVRQTNRSAYNSSIITEDKINLLKTVDFEPCIRTYFFKNGTSEFTSISDLIYEGNSRQMRDSNFKRELHQWMRYNKKDQDTTRDGLSYSVFGAPNLPYFIAKWIVSRVVNEKSQNRSDRKKISSSSHFILFTTQNNTIEEWINLGRTMERTLLKITEMGISHAYMNQPNEIFELSQKMAEIVGIKNEYPTILIRVGYGKKMPYSLRKKVEDFLIE
ncbi:MAG: nitroreductase [Candidatus Cloacimonadota bacterium]|nr:MAG: nitroreductase [Candidatus Cloacimonadota bacterium]PIE77849.1 MAG: nitroreductase [Candidatus Delongbacteria bacterium]